MAARDELTGRSVGEFVLRECIGEGGFGAVYRAEQPLLGREAVIKVLHHRLRANEVVIQRFLREARLASRIDHPYAAHVYAFGVEKEDGLLWIAMEMVHGTPLDRWLVDRGPLSLKQLVPFVERIAEVVQTAHERGIVHRDLKPSNVMVIERAGRLLPKLLDLGIAKLVASTEADAATPPPTSRKRTPTQDLARGATLSADAAAAPERTAKPSEMLTMTASDTPTPALARDHGLTDAGALMGSPPYMPPELWANQNAGPATDLYSLGVLIYEALTGYRPFKATSLVGYADQHANAPVPPIGEGHPAALDRFFARALAKKPDDRPATALELAASLRVASGLADAPVELPRLEVGVRDAWLADAPQPLAEAVAAVDGARNLHQGRAAARDLAAGLVRYLWMMALAAHAQVRDDRDEQANELLRALRLREPSNEERLRLMRMLTRRFVGQRDAHPIPELVDLLARTDGPLEALLSIDSGDLAAADDLLRLQLARTIAQLATAMRAASFVLDYVLVVKRGEPERWMSLRRPRRACAVVRAELADEQPVLIERDGRIALALWPFAQIREPAPGAEPELFVFDGPGRHGARLVASPVGFECHDPAFWDWYAEHVLDTAVEQAHVAGEESGPYLGLATFTRADAERFIGRERETDAFVNRLQTQPLQIVVGASGAGKSSFINAGVLPALSAGWRAVSMRPGARPIAALAAKLRSATIVQDDVTSLLTATPATAATAIARALGDGRLVIFVDQLEELFTLCLDEDERTRFAAALVELSASPEGSVRVIATVRDDFLMRVESLAPLRPRLASALFLLGNPAREDLVRTLVEPARRVGYEFSDADLPLDMATALEGRPGALALLSFTAAQLWELRDRRFHHITRKAYDAMGGVGGALGKHAEETFNALDATEQRLVREAFRRLVTSEGTRAQLTVDELEQVLASDRARGVIDKLIAARLVVTLDHDQGARIEVAHEALLTAWPRVQEWSREDAETARLREQLGAASRQWIERGRTKALLWRGDVLLDLERWRARGAVLTDAERAFADASSSDARRARRIRRVLGFSVVGVLALVVVVLARLNAEASEQRHRAEQNASEARQLAADTKRRLAQQSREQGRLALVGGKPGVALVHLLAALDQGSPQDTAMDFMIGEAMRPLEAQTHVLAGHRGVVWSLDVIDDKRIVTAGDDGTLRVWDLAAGKQLASATAGVPLGYVHVDPTRTRLVAAGKDGIARLYSLDAELLHELRVDGAGFLSVFHPAFSPDGSLLATVHGLERVVRVWDVATGALRHTFAVGRGASEFYAKQVVWSPDGSRLVVAGTELIDARTGGLRARLPHDDVVATTVFAPDGAVFATGSYDRTTRIWDATGKRVELLEGHDGDIEVLAFDPSGRYLLSASRDRKARVWDRVERRSAGVLVGHDAAIKAVAFDRNNARVATGDESGQIRLWHAPDGRMIGMFEGHGAAITALTFVGDGLVSASADGTVRLWDVTRTGVHMTPVCREPRAMAVGSSDIAVGCADGSVDMIVQGRHVRGAPSAATPTSDVGFVGDRVLTRSTDGRLRMWSGDSDVTPQSLAEVRAAAIAIAPDGKRFAIAASDGDVAFWDANAERATTRMRLPGSVDRIALLADGKLVRHTDDALEVYHAGAERPAVRVADEIAAWDVASTGTIATLSTRELALWSSGGAARARIPHEHIGAFMPRFDATGSRVVTSGQDGVLRVWSDAGKKLADLEGHLGRVIGAYFDDRGLVVSVGVDGTMRVWDPSSAALLGSYVHHRGVIYALGLSGQLAISLDFEGMVVGHEFAHTRPDLAAARRIAKCLPYHADNGRILRVSETPCR